MFNIGPLELMVLLVLALIVFGPAKLPELMASAGNAIREFQRASRELTSVFEETQSEFTSAMNIDDLMQSGGTDAATANNVAPSYSVENPITDASAPEPSVAVNVAPAEYETAAGMIDPFEPFESPPTAMSEIPVIPQVGPEEYATSAGLVEPPVPFDPVPESITVTDPAVIVTDTVVITGMPIENANGVSIVHRDGNGHSMIAESRPDDIEKSRPISVGRSEEKV